MSNHKKTGKLIKFTTSLQLDDEQKLEALQHILEAELHVSKISRNDAIIHAVEFILAHKSDQPPTHS